MLDRVLLQSSILDATTHPTEGLGKLITLYDADYLCDRQLPNHDLTGAAFPGPLLGKTMKKEDLVQFIRRKTQECLIKDDKPDQDTNYVFWLIMEKFCTQSRNIRMLDIIPLLLKGYDAFKNKRSMMEDHWCLSLACHLSKYCDSEDEVGNSVTEMGDTLASKGQIYPAHICYVVARVELDSYRDRTSFALIGSNGLPLGTSAMREAFERTEIYEYALWLKSGFMQPNFQIFKMLHTSRLTESGQFAQARKYCRTIAMAVATFPRTLTVTLISRLLRLSETLHQEKAKKPKWLVNLRHLFLFKVEQIAGNDYITPEQQVVWNVDSQLQCTVTVKSSTVHHTALKLQAEMWDVDSESDGTPMLKKPTTYLNAADLQPEVWDVDSGSDGSLMPENPTTYFNTADLQPEIWDVGSGSDGTLMPKKPTTYLNAADLQPEVWDVGSGSDGTLVPKKPTRYLNTADLQPEVWDVGSGSDGTPMPENPTTYLNTADLQPEIWDVDSGSNGTLMLEKPTIYFNTVDLHPEVWNVDSDNEIQKMESFYEPEAQRFLALYKVGNLLGSGGFGSVYEGVCKKDGRQVAIKFISKDSSNVYITIPGETCKLHLEVALMKIVSEPPHCNNILQLLDWFDLHTCLLLVLERPIPCMDVYDFCMSQGGMLDELSAKLIMLQVVKAAFHCHTRRVFHRDIKAENIIVNTKTMEIKLTDFGCGDLWKCMPYHDYSGMPTFFPPEWILDHEYYAYSASVWSLGILLFSLVCGTMPFNSEREIVGGTLNFKPGLSKACCHLIKWCLEQDPIMRPNLTQISEHEWFTEDQTLQRSIAHRATFL